MKLNKSNLFILIWGAHLFIYYLIYATTLKIVRQDFNELHNVFLSFVVGFIGLLEQIPLFFLIPLFLMLILITIKLKYKWFLAYVVSVCLGYLGNYLWMYSNNKHDKILGMPEQINLIYFIIPSLMFSILCNWIIFRKKYEKLGV